MEFSPLQKTVTQGVEPAWQGGHLQLPGFDLESMVDVAHDYEIPVHFLLAAQPFAGPELDLGRLVPGGGPALAAEPGTEGVKEFRVKGFGHNNSGPGAYNSPEGIISPIEFHEPVAVDEQETPVSELDDFCFPGGAAAVPLVHETRGPDIVVAPDEVDPGPGIADPVQFLEDGIITIKPEMGIIEPEIEDVAEQDQVVRLGRQVDKFQEFGQPRPLGLVGTQMKMGIGHDEDRGLLQIIHAA